MLDFNLFLCIISLLFLFKKKKKPVSSLPSIICPKIFEDGLGGCCNQHKSTSWKEIICLLERMKDLAFPGLGPYGL